MMGEPAAQIQGTDAGRGCPDGAFGARVGRGLEESKKICYNTIQSGTARFVTVLEGKGGSPITERA